MKKIMIPKSNDVIKNALNLVLVSSLVLVITGCSNKTDANAPQKTSKPSIEKEVPTPPVKRTVDFTKVLSDMDNTVEEYTKAPDAGENYYNKEYSDKILGYCNGDKDFINKNIGEQDLPAVISNIEILASYDIYVDKKLSSFWKDMMLDAERAERFETEVIKIIEETEQTKDYSEIAALAEEYKKQPKHNDPFKNVQMIIFSTYLSQSKFDNSNSVIEDLKEIMNIIKTEDLTISNSKGFVRTLNRA